MFLSTCQWIAFSTVTFTIVILNLNERNFSLQISVFLNYQPDSVERGSLFVFPFFWCTFVDWKNGQFQSLGTKYAPFTDNKIGKA